MAEKVRVRCPVCGLTPFLENLEQTVEEKPTEVRIFLMKFGGKVAAGTVPSSELEGGYKKKKRGSATGYMEIIDVTDQQPDQVIQMEEFFKSRCQEFLASLKKKI